MKKWILWGLLSLISAQTQAFSCYYTVLKEDCWKEYDVLVNIWDASNGKMMARVKIPAGNEWGRVRFDCQAGQSFRYTASYSPEFWLNGKKDYKGQKTLTLPREVKSDEKAWHIRLCYGEAFAEVPMPPTAKKNCFCEWNKVTELKVKGDA